MCGASSATILRRMNELRSKEGKVEKDYGLRPYGNKTINRAVGIDDSNMFYKPGGRAIPTNRTGE